MSRSQHSHQLYKQVVQVSIVYFGPAAERFITRQLQNHLSKSPQDLTKRDLAQLIDWIQVAVSIITEDKEIVEEYIGQLRKLVNSERGKKKQTQGGSRG
jgi:hypothetical protein